MMPMPPPTANVAEISAMPVATRALGNSSRTMPMPSGKTAPPMPWMPRPTSIGPIDVESAEMTVPTASARSTTTSTRSLPNMSPSRPAIGVATEAVSR